ncbi:MAG TPA: anti-sigma factor antagonist [Candidatus Acidoferrum sp.]|jgi:anti-sigma B factor antagonist|nr:anti-sigma factor antagonist [Candidatus Acidoferrum sp.]
MLQISARHLDKTTILDVSGDIDLASSPDLRRALLRELRELRIPRVVLNLKAVEYVDSSGVASLVEGLKASRDVGSRLILFGLNTAVREVLQLSKLLRIFEIAETEEQAVAP